MAKLFSIFWLTFWISSARSTISDPSLTDVYSGRVNTPIGNKIPRNVWLTMKDKTLLRDHTKALMARNPTWKFIISEDKEADKFIAQAFANTSFSWAFNLINPNLGAAKADLWRYAVLWKYGGFYFDADSDMLTPLDDIVQPNDELLIGTEKNAFSGDRCYHPLYHLSDAFVHKKYGETSPLFKGKIVINWGIAAAPGHPFLERTMENAVEAIRGEFEGEPVMKHYKFGPKWHIVICCTGPALLTASIREVILENSLKSANFNFRYVGNDFGDYKGVYKIGNQNAPNHYSDVLKHQDLLREYQMNSAVNSERLHRWQGKCIQGISKPAIYFVDGGKRRPIPDFDTFEMLNFTVADVKIISDYKLGTIPVGDPMPAIPRSSK